MKAPCKLCALRSTGTARQWVTDYEPTAKAFANFIGGTYQINRIGLYIITIT